MTKEAKTKPVEPPQPENAFDHNWCSAANFLLTRAAGVYPDDSPLKWQLEVAYINSWPIEEGKLLLEALSPLSEKLELDYVITHVAVSQIMVLKANPTNCSIYEHIIDTENLASIFGKEWNKGVVPFLKLAMSLHTGHDDVSVHENIIAKWGKSQK